MKTNLLFLCLTFCVMSLKAQTGYWYGSEFINLVADGSGYCYVQLPEDDATSNGWVKEHPESFMPLGAEGYLTTEECAGAITVSYRSGLYIRTDKNGNGLSQETRVVILPRVTLKLKGEEYIDELKAEYGDKLLDVKSNKALTTIECNLPDAVHVFDLINELCKKVFVEWCEPDMYSNIDFDALGLSEPLSEILNENGVIYDLQGRRVSPHTSSLSPLKKGIYIENGRKRVVSR